jgi:hypothetical protein
MHGALVATTPPEARLLFYRRTIFICHVTWSPAVLTDVSLRIHLSLTLNDASGVASNTQTSRATWSIMYLCCNQNGILLSNDTECPKSMNVTQTVTINLAREGGSTISVTNPVQSPTSSRHSATENTNQHCESYVLTLTWYTVLNQYFSSGWMWLPECKDVFR